MKNGDKVYQLRDALNDFKSALRAIRDSVTPQVKTLQIFPRGDMVTYSGEFPHYADESGAELPPDEQKRIQAQVLADRWIEAEILANQSSLVSDLISEDRDGFTLDDIENVYRDFSESTMEECREYLRDIGGDEPESEDIDEWRTAANELAQENPNESYQWWLVTEWLCGKLREAGEIVINNGYGQWWGRGCCGQSITQDGTIQAIARKIIDA